MIKRVMTYSKNNGLKLDIPNEDKIESFIIGEIWEEISRQIESLFSYGDMYDWEKVEWEIPNIGDKTLVVPVWFPKNFDGRFSDEIQVKTGHIETLDYAKVLQQATQDAADKYGYVPPNFDEI